MKTTRYMKLDFSKLNEVLSYNARHSFKINEAVLRNTVKFAPRFQADNGYMLQAPGVIDQYESYPLVNDRWDGVYIGKFSDIAPWDEKRHTWKVYLNGTPGASIYGDGASLYQLYLKEEKGE